MGYFAQSTAYNFRPLRRSKGRIFTSLLDAAQPYYCRTNRRETRQELRIVEHKIHLLAWSTTVTLSEFEGLGKGKELAKLLHSKGKGPFDRIWVFGYGEKSIIFDSANAIQAGNGSMTILDSAIIE